MAAAGNAQIAVDGAGACGGSSPCYTTIQAGVNAAAAGQTVTVYPGNYVENVLINTGISLQSLSGAANTTITGIGPNNYQAPVMIQGPVSGVTIGGSPNHGFTILGTDNSLASMESSAIQIGGPSFLSVANVMISYNTITSQGEAGVLSYYNSTDYINGLTIQNNTFNGKTFTGSTPASGGLFSDVNTPKSAIGINLGAANTTVSSNTFSTITGAGTLGNAIIQVNSNGSSIMMNNITAHTGGTKGAMDIRGTASAIGCNRFDMTDIGTSGGSYIVTTNGTAPYVISNVATGNTFLPAGYIFTNSIVTTASGTAANSAYPAPGCTVVPVQLISFSAALTGNTGIAVRWQTANELNSDHYIVEQSADALTYTEAANVHSQGNGDHTYATVIFPQKAGTVFLRLRQVDADGRAVLSKVVSVNMGKPLIQVLNNPAKGTLQLSGIQGNTKISIYNSIGSLVKQAMVSGGYAQVDISGLAGGVYLMSAVDNTGTVTTLKIAVQ